MEIAAIVLLVIVTIGTVYNIFISSKNNARINDLEKMINKSIMNQEDSKQVLLVHLEEVKNVIVGEIIETNKNNNLILNSIKSDIENGTRLIKQDLSPIKDRLEYLSTEVNIE